MSVRARFYISEINKKAYNPGAAEVKLTAVSRGDQNKQWASATPAGTVTLTATVTGQPAADHAKRRSPQTQHAQS